MDSFELNKIMGAVLGTLLFVMGVGFVAESIYHPIENRGPGYNLPEPEPTTEVAEAGAEEVVPLPVLLASASAEAGASAVRKCQSCHNFGEGEPNKQGPALYGVVGRPEGGVPGFAYSDTLMAYNAEGRTWTYDSLDHFLARPADYAPGTKMNFAGVRSAEERADILAYLQTLSPSPVPFPAPEEAPAEGAPADEGAATTEEGAAEEENPATAPADEVSTEQAPAAVTDTPTETQSDTPVQGTPTTSGPGAAPPLPGTPAAEGAGSETGAPAAAPAQ
ncbi:c-type cytochrome [Devosia albogilva]|uniref:C-type cytochrome n=1 Tax=Devosia albogilva TaxID=429726 RepID=A0ABW5QLR2_9HYPH